MRARPIAGDPALAEEALAFIREEMVLGGAAGPESEEALNRDVWKMRQKIEGHSRPGDLKRSAGGILDVEFLVQALQLRHGKRSPGVLTPNTPTAIGAMMRERLLDDLTGSELLTSYQFLRSIENRISLVGEGTLALEGTSREGPSSGGVSSALAAAGTSPDRESRDMESLVQKIGYKSTGEESALEIFQGELDYYRRRNRAHLLRVLRIA
jgi:glutamine synthetase adenylyltransferase